jgi:hypothetical protein
MTPTYSFAGDYDTYVQKQKSCYGNPFSEITCYFKSRYDLLNSLKRNTESLANPIVLSGIRGAQDNKNICPLQVSKVFIGELSPNQILTINNCTLIEQYNSIFVVYEDDSTTNNTIKLANKSYTISYLTLGSIENEATLLEGSISFNEWKYQVLYTVFTYWWVILAVVITIWFILLGLKQLAKDKGSHSSTIV